MVKKVEKMCKNLQKTLRIKVVKLCVKNRSFKKCVENWLYSQTFSTFFTNLFASQNSLFYINNIHISTEPITTTNIKLINNSNY